MDIIIGCSHQCSDTLQAIELINKFLAYHTNAYVIRSSVCMEVDGNIGGGSQIVSPYGNVLADMANRVGMVCAEFDPHNKYHKPAGFGNPPAAHYEYIDLGRRPWQIVDRAIEIGCQKVQLFKPYFDQSMVDKAHEHGIRCNVFYADDPEEAKQYLDMGIDTILTNNYRVIAETVRGCKK